MFHNGGSSQVKVVLGKDVYIYSLRMVCASHWSSGSHSVHPNRLTFSRTSCSGVGTSDSDWGDWGVGQVTSFSEGFGPLVWLTFDGSPHSFGGRSLTGVAEHLPIRDFLSCLYITYDSFGRNTNLPGQTNSSTPFPHALNLRQRSPCIC